MAASAQAPALQPTRQWGRDDRRGNRLASGASADGEAWCVWPRLVRRPDEEGTSPVAIVAPARGGDRPPARTRTDEGPYETSLLEIGRRENSLRSKQKVSLSCCQALG